MNEPIKIPPDNSADCISLRNYFAAMAIQGILGNKSSWRLSTVDMAIHAYKVADEMLKHTESTTPKDCIDCAHLNKNNENNDECGQCGYDFINWTPRER